MDSELDFERAKHVYSHLASAATKLEARQEIKEAIVTSKAEKIQPKEKPKKAIKPKKPTKRDLLIKELIKKVGNIEKKIARMKASDGYDNERLFKIEMKVEIIKNRIKKFKDPLP